MCAPGIARLFARDGFSLGSFCNTWHCPTFLAGSSPVFPWPLGPPCCQCAFKLEIAARHSAAPSAAMRAIVGRLMHTSAHRHARGGPAGGGRRQCSVDPEVLNRKVYWWSEHSPCSRTLLQCINRRRDCSIFTRLLAAQSGYYQSQSLPNGHKQQKHTDMHKLKQLTVDSTSGRFDTIDAQRAQGQEDGHEQWRHSQEEAFASNWEARQTMEITKRLGQEHHDHGGQENPLSEEYETPTLTPPEDHLEELSKGENESYFPNSSVAYRPGGWLEGGRAWARWQQEANVAAGAVRAKFDGLSADGPIARKTSVVREHDRDNWFEPGSVFSPAALSEIPPGSIATSFSAVDGDANSSSLDDDLSKFAVSSRSDSQSPLFHVLSMPGPMTLLVPTNSAMFQIPTWMRASLLSSLPLASVFLREHMLAKFWLLRDLSGSSYQPWSKWNRPRSAPHLLSTFANTWIQLDVRGEFKDLPHAIHLTSLGKDPTRVAHATEGRRREVAALRGRASGLPQMTDPPHTHGDYTIQGRTVQFPTQQVNPHRPGLPAQRSRPPIEAVASDATPLQNGQGDAFQDLPRPPPARIIRSDIRCHNGVVHFLDGALISPALVLAAWSVLSH
eukprot:GHVT01069689.1.p1 GENE.GHVT01069689.1~~GHVT01069689.1.p1  ORF type:complete len:614 (+),score=70.67 GHVT01069689.1:2326-4167(+)